MLALCIMTAQKQLSYVASSTVKKKAHCKIDIRLFAIYLSLLYVGKLLISCECLCCRGGVHQLPLCLCTGLQLPSTLGCWVSHFEPVLRLKNKHVLQLERCKCISNNRHATTQCVQSTEPHRSPCTLQAVLAGSWEMQTVPSAKIRCAWALVKCTLRQPSVGSTECCLFYKATKTSSLVY